MVGLPASFWGESGVTQERTDSRARAYWCTNLRILTILLAVWAVAGFGLGIIAVPWLNAIHVAGFPLGFWFAQQGSIVIFVILILVYALWMDRVEQRMHTDRSQNAPASASRTAPVTGPKD